MDIFLGNLQITPEILNLISDIDQFKGAWQQMNTLSPERLSALKRVATIESVGSSTRIEGAKLTDREIEALLSHVENQTFETRDEQEVAGYAFVCEQIFTHFHQMLLSENGIKQLHTWLLQFTEKDSRHRGSYKKVPIRIEAFDGEGKSKGVIFETTSPFETPFQMERLVNWTNDAFQRKEWHPLIIIGLFIVIFLAIHPFQDGNGRLSRLLTTLLMLKNGYFYAPYTSLESIIEANKESYYLALQKTQKNWQNEQVDWNAWLLFFFRCLARQKTHLEAKLVREAVIVKALPPLAQNIVELVREHGSLKIKELEALTEANRNTLKKTLQTLTKEKKITLHGKGKGVWYSLFL